MAAAGGSSSSFSASTYHHYRSHQFGDTTLTKVFVGGLAWETHTDKMREYFVQFGEILEAVIIIDKHTGKSKGYGFVTFGDPESAKRAVVEANPMIDGRRANCNIASAGRPTQSPPLGNGQGQNGQIYNSGGGGGGGVQGDSLYKPVHGPLMSSTMPSPVTLMYPPQYGYPAGGYNPVYGYNQATAVAMYNQQLQQAQYYQQLYGPTSPNLQAPYNPYYYAYSMHVAAATRAVGVAGGGVTSSYTTFPTSQRSQVPYLYYSSPTAFNMSPTAMFYPQLQQHQPPGSSDSSRHLKLPSQLDSQESSQVTSPEREGKVVTSGSP